MKNKSKRTENEMTMTTWMHEETRVFVCACEYSQKNMKKVFHLRRRSWSTLWRMDEVESASDILSTHEKNIWDDQQKFFLKKVSFEAILQLLFCLLSQVIIIFFLQLLTVTTQCTLNGECSKKLFWTTSPTFMREFFCCNFNAILKNNLREFIVKRENCDLV